MSKPSVQLLLTGNELMTGDIVDSNSAMMAEILKDIGLTICRKVTVADDLSLLIDEIKQMSSTSDILIINGGLGPTVDDLTAQALSEAINSPLAQHPAALEHLTRWCKKRGAQLNDPNLKQTILPKQSHIIANKNGSAVGFSVRFNECDIYCTPGVPHELQTMLNEEIVPTIAKALPENISTHITRLQVFGMGESNLQKLINEKLPDWPSEVELGFRAGVPLLEVKLTINTPEAKPTKEKWLQKLIDTLGDHVIDIIKDKPKSLAEHVLGELQRKTLKITTAESCTGGLIASKLTEISGSSKSFEAGFVTYSNTMKTTLLDVPNAVLLEQGAVSEAVVIAMAKGALSKANADLAIAVSGIAGPTGGSEEKPVGTVWIAWGTEEEMHSQCLLIPYKRKQFQHFVASTALDLVRRFLKKSTDTPNYITERSFPKRS